jgi:RHH-type transcriptional regulator, rel operon repressor / antitoxin RelB
MRSATFTVRVDAAAKKRLERLARSTGRSRSFLAAEAIKEYLDVNEWQVAGIKQAIASLDRGEGVSHEQKGLDHILGQPWRADCVGWAKRKRAHHFNLRRHGGHGTNAPLPTLQVQFQTARPQLRDLAAVSRESCP